VRLIIVDLDGTFVRPSASSLFPSIRELQRSLSSPKYQVGVTIATGRAWAGAQKIINELSIPSATPLILYNGAVVLEHGSTCVISQRSIPRTTVEQVAKICQSFGLQVFSYWFDDPVAAGFRSSAMERVYATGVPPSRDFNDLPVNTWARQDVPDSHCVAMLAKLDSEAIASHLISALSSVNEITCTSSSWRYVEIRPARANKGEGLRHVARHLKLDMAEILALGDSDNDSEMLRAAGIGVSVQGASDIAIDSSDFICHYGAAEGAVEVMRLVKHAKRYFGKSYRR
jgi:Cof subfamily protein (haloacid dehalogenase superfamily)